MSTNGTLSAPAQAVSAVLFDPGNTSLDPTTETIVRGFGTSTMLIRKRESIFRLFCIRLQPPVSKRLTCLKQ